MRFKANIGIIILEISALVNCLPEKCLPIVNTRRITPHSSIYLNEFCNKNVVIFAVAAAAAAATVALFFLQLRS